MSTDPKSMAKILRRELQAKTIELPHNACLEIVAKQVGFRDWNTLAASTPATDASADPAHPYPAHGAPTAGGLSSLPQGWASVGQRKSAYDVGVVTDPGPRAAPALIIRAKDGASGAADAWTAIRQCISARRYLDCRIAFAADMRCEDVEDCAFMWLRVDNALGQKLAYAGRWEAPENTILTGTADWVPRAVVVAVPPGAVTIEFGVTLNGGGTLMAANLRFNATDLPVTALREIAAEEPYNLDLATR
jgi:hypothetical protein